jgi:hypothetical protein
VRTGWVRVTSNPGKVNASVRFVVTGAGSSVVDSVGVLASEPVRYWSVPVATTSPDQYVGLAAVNPYDSPLEFTFTLYSKNTTVQGPVKRTLPARGHLAIFTDQLFGARFTGVGSVDISTNGSDVPVMALRLDGQQLSALPANENCWALDWVTTSGSSQLGGRFYWTYHSSGTFTGLGVTSLGGQWQNLMRGEWNQNRFFVERPYAGTGGEIGLVVYQGTSTGSGSDVVITGTRTLLRSEGIVVVVQSFRATGIK